MGSGVLGFWPPESADVLASPPEPTCFAEVEHRMDPERNRLKHLMVILLEALSDAEGPSRSRILEKVASAGLDETDVNGLLDWIESQWQPLHSDDYYADPWPEAPSGQSFRHFGDLDQACLTGSAMGFLLELQAAGQISRAQMEALIQYSSYVALQPLERADLETVIEQVLFRGGRPGLTGGASEGFDSAH